MQLCGELGVEARHWRAQKRVASSNGESRHACLPVGRVEVPLLAG
jgi:hypothetical protein